MARTTEDHVLSIMTDDGIVGALIPQGTAQDVAKVWTAYIQGSWTPQDDPQHGELCAPDGAEAVRKEG